MQLLLKYKRPMCHGYYEKKFDEYEFNWKVIYGIPRIAAYKPKIPIF